MDKQFYTPMEALLINAMKQRQEYEDAIKTKKEINELLALDLALLEAEAGVGLMDGLPVLPEEVPANE